MSVIHPVILCGGSGTRLWPLSRKSYPKQFSALLDDGSLFEASVRRTAGPGRQDVRRGEADHRRARAIRHRWS